MAQNFENAFDDFLMQCMGEDIALLREKNERYRNALSEHSELRQKAKDGKIDDYGQAFNRLAELSEYIRDVEIRCVYYAGMAAHKKIGDVISSYGSFGMFNL